MASTTLAVTAPHATAYDSDWPTRSTENYSHTLHDILQDMEDEGTWYLTDETPATSDINTICTYIHDVINDVFDYCEGAIDTYRSTGTPTLSEPTVTSPIAKPGFRLYPQINSRLLQLYAEGMKICYFVYYMWKTEEDPLLLKEKLQELLVAWPLTDTQITLNEEGGQTLRVTPAWKNVDI